MGSLSLTENSNANIKPESNSNIKNNEMLRQSVCDVSTENHHQEPLDRQPKHDEFYISDERDDGGKGSNGCKRRFDLNRITTNESVEKEATLEDDQVNKDDYFAFNKSLLVSDENSLNNGNSVNGTQSDSNCSNDGSSSKSEAGNKTQQNFAEPEQLRKLFIGGLDYKTCEASLKQHFDKFGEVIDCVVMRDPQSKRSRGFGFVTYASSCAVDKAQTARPHEIDGREVQSKRAISREDSGNVQPNVKKVYLGGLSDDIEEPELRDYFESFGNIVNVHIVAHKDTGKRRGFAFVEYDDYDPVDKIVIIKFHTIRDKRIEAKKAIPKVEMDARKRNDSRAAMAGVMLAGAFTGPLDAVSSRPRSGRNNGLWDGPYNSGSYPSSYSANQANMNGYPPHYHSPSNHYGSSSWVVHGNLGGNYGGFRGSPPNGAYARNNYSNLANSWAGSGDYLEFPASQASAGGAGPMRLSYQHRNWSPYGNYGAHRGRGYNP